MVAALGGPADLLERPDAHLPAAPVTVEAFPTRRARSTSVDVRAVGVAIIGLGGGRARETDQIDHAVGLTEVAAPGEHVGPGERPLARVHARRPGRRPTGPSPRCGRPARSATQPPEIPAAGPRGPAVIPKAELHVHLEGTAPPELIAPHRAAQRPARARRAARRRRALRLHGLPRLPAHLRPRRERHPHRRGLPRHHLRVPALVRRARARSTSS